jgi:MFS family permease
MIFTLWFILIFDIEANALTVENVMQRNEPLRLQNILIVSLASIYYLYMFFVRVLPSVITNDLMLDFQTGGHEISLLIVIFVYGYSLSQIPAGIWIDRYGAKRVMLAGMLGCFISSYLFQATDNLWITILSRGLLGFSCGPSFIAPMALAKEYLPKRFFTPAAGFIQVLGCVGAMLTKPVTVWTERLGWREVVFSSALLALFLIAVYSLLPKDKPKEADYKPLATKQALSRIIQTPHYWIIGFFGFASWAAIGGFTEAWGISYLATLQDITISKATAQMNWAWIGVAISSPLAGFWYENANNKIIPLVTMYACGFIGLFCLIATSVHEYYTISALLFLLGISAGAQPISFKLMSKVAPRNIQATAMSFCNICVTAGAFLLQPLITHILEFMWDGKMQNNIPFFQAHQYQVSFLPILVILIIAIFASLFTERFTNNETS